MTHQAFRIGIAGLAAACLLPATLLAGNPTLVSRDANGTPGDDASGLGSTGSSARIDISGDGRYVGFISRANNLVGGVSDAFSHAFRYDRQSGTLIVLDTSSDGILANGGATNVALSDGGEWAVLESCATNLVANDLNGFCDVFVKDIASGTMQRVNLSSAGAEANNAADSVGNNRLTISADGRYVLFASLATTLVASDTNGRQDCFLRDRQSATTVRVNLGAGGEQSTVACRRPTMSPDARWIVYSGSITGACRRFDRSNGGVVDVPYVPDPPPNNFACTRPEVSDDGNRIAFDQPTGQLADVLANSVVRIDVNAQGSSDGTGAVIYGISGDGRLVMFNSDATNLDQPPGAFGFGQMYVKDTASGTSYRISQLGSGSPASVQTLQGALSRDGSTSAFYASTNNWGIAGAVLAHAYVETDATNAIFGLYPDQGSFE